MGLILLLILAGCFLLWTGVAVILHAAHRPTRDGIGRALAQGRPTEPGQVGLDAESWSLRTRDGLDLPTLDARTGVDGPTVLWLHDWSGSQLGLLELLPSWASWCGRIVTFDARGHGDAPGSCTLGHREAEDLSAMLECIGDEPLVLAGEGLGAVLALNAAMQGHVEPLGVFALDPFVRGSDRFRHDLRASGYHVFPVADLALVMLWLRSQSPLELQWPPSAPDIPVLARFTGSGMEEFREFIPAGAPVSIEEMPGTPSEGAGAVAAPWW